MSWLRIEDAMPEHQKVFRAASVLGGTHSYARVMSVIVQALCFSGRNLTDGFLPLEAVRRLHDSQPLKTAKALVDAHLWEACEGGFQIHDYHAYNPSSAEVKSDKEWDRRRKELYANPSLVKAIKERDRHCCRYCGVEVNWQDRRGPIGGQFDHVEPRGANSFENIVVACRGCNMKKNNRTPDQAGMPLLPIPQYLIPHQNGTSSHPLGDVQGMGLDRKIQNENESPVTALIRHYHEGYVARFGEKPNISDGKDGATLKRLAGTHGVEAVKCRIDRLLDSTDSFIAGSGRTIGVLSSCWNKLGGPLKPKQGSSRLPGCKHMPPCVDAAAHTQREIADMKRPVAS